MQVSVCLGAILIPKYLDSILAILLPVFFPCHPSWRAIACSAGVFWTRECTFSYLGRPSWILVTVEVWGEEIFPEGVGVKREINHPRWRHRTRFII